MHERVSPSGNHRLVVVTAPLSVQPGDGDRDVDPLGVWDVNPVDVSVVTPATWGSDIVEAPQWPHGLLETNALSEARRFSIFPGIPDPRDASHFTIRFDGDGSVGTIEGWLRDDDTVTFKVVGAPPWAYRDPE